MLPNFEKYENSEIYFDDETVAYYPSEHNLKKLEELALANIPNALYETGINMINARFGTIENKTDGLDRIIKSYELGNTKALRYLIYNCRDSIKVDDLDVDLSNEEELRDINSKNLSEKIYLKVYNEYNLNIEENLNIILDAYKSGNKLGAKLYIEWLLGEYIYPIKAQEAYDNIKEMYPFLDFSDSEWYQAIDLISWIINLDKNMVPKAEYLKEKLTLDATTNQHLVWCFVHYSLTNQHRMTDLYDKVITEIYNESPDILKNLKNEDIKKYYDSHYKTK